MKRLAIAIVAVWLLMPMNLTGQTYQTLWKQVEEAQQKDLPQTAMTSLDRIAAKARKESAYGQLLKSTLLRARLQSEVAPDSLRPAVSRLEDLLKSARGEALKAVYATVLSKVYSENVHVLGDDAQQKSRDYRDQALAHPEQLAKVSADSYVPFVVKENDSELFGHDLLSIVGQELDAWQWLSRYYQQAGNRRAACLTALRATKTLESYDSLIAVYGDLPEAGEVAISRYELMHGNRFTAADRYTWLQQSLERWGSWKRADVLRNDLKALLNPMFQVDLQQRVSVVDKTQTILLTHLRHVQSVQMRLYRTALNGDTELNPNEERDYRQMKGGLKELKEHARTLTFSGHADYDVFEDSLTLAALPAGVYLLEFSSQPQTEVIRMLYFVSGVRVIMQALPNDQIRYVVVDATTGQPLPGASLRLSFRRQWDKQGTSKTLPCDTKGEVLYTVEGQQPTSAFAYTAADQYCPESSGYGRYSYYERTYNQEHISLFTDRSIYRPGQTVHVAAIVWKELSATEQTAVSNKALKVELRDANYKVVSEQQLTTDRYGKCSAVFTLPKGLLNGRFSIRTQSASASFRVEEYKRPTFQVEFPDHQSAYQAGDVVHALARAMTYSGVPVQGAKVHYTVRRRVAFWWMNWSRYWQHGYAGRGLAEDVVNEGDTQTEEDGTFIVDMPMVLPDDANGQTMFYHFVVEADVTDQAGETHSGTLSLPLGTKPTALTCDLPAQVRSDQLPQVTFVRRNAAGKEIVGQVKYRLDGGKWKQCLANSQLSIFNSQLKSGEHRLEAVCEGDSLQMSFVVFSLNDKRPAAPTHNWFYVSHQQFPSDKTPVTIQVGSSDPDLHIVYSIFAGKEQLESGAVKKSGELINRQLTYQESYGNGLLVTFAWVKDGVCYRHETTIQRPMPDKKLKLAWETFRDRLTPGQQETWCMTVSRPDGTPADASLMAVLYDHSLDAIAPHQWMFAPSVNLSLPSTSWRWNAWGSMSRSGAQTLRYQHVPDLLFSHFDDSVYPYYHRHIMVRGRSNVMLAKSAATNVGFAVADEAAVPQMAMVATEETKAVKAKDVAGNDADDAAADQVTLRENLNETAFCYPAVTTDKTGRVTLSFTLPESLTTWRFMGVANTSDMLYGALEAETVAHKDLMVQPNLPRFLRIGDEAYISARITNCAGRPLKGQARLQLIDPQTNAVLYEKSQPFTTDGDQTVSVTYPLSKVDYSTSLLICRITAVAGDFSDGEQHYLPVLPDQEYVTRTLPFTQHEAGVQTVDLKRLFPQGTSQQKLTVEYTANPAWLMVQSLPVIGQPSEHSAIDQAASYYSNQLAKFLLDGAPQAKATFEQWKHETPEQSSLTSQLEKNQELKDLLLAETPWVAAADRESEQHQRLADFFDENMINNRLTVAADKLKALQNGDGSFSWYPGMKGSTQITVSVAEMVVRLQTLTGAKSDLLSLYNKAFTYMGKEMTELVNELKKEERKGHRPTFPSFTALRWLYVCALDGRQLSGTLKSTNDYLVNLLKKDIKNQSIYEKALTAVILNQRGDRKLAADYVKSLKEYTVYTDEMGRYYDTPRALYSWYDYKIPTEVAAIEALQAVTPADCQTVDEMRRWLLQEKRTQAWDTPINTVNAIYAFLHGESQLLTATSQPAVLAVDGTPIDVPIPSAGIGYVKTARPYQGEQTLTATKQSEGTSWGAVYAQFFQPVADIEASESGITVKREILAASTLKVGDRVKVRITIETTRDLDFVQVVDRRAACMEPVSQLTGYRNGAYTSPKDCATHYFFGQLAKGRHQIETEYYIDREGIYQTGTCTVGCAYAPEYRATAPSMTLHIQP